MRPLAIKSAAFGLAVLVASVALPAAAAWREDLGTFRIGIVGPSRGVPAVEGLPEIRQAYASALGMPVEIFVARDYAALVDAQGSGRVHYAVHTAMSYAATSRLCACVEPLASPLSADGSTGIVSVLIARRDGPGSLEGLGETRIAIGPPDSVTGYLLPLAQFEAGGKRLESKEPFLVQAESDGQALQMFEEGEADALFGWAYASAEGQTSGGTRAISEAAAQGKVLWTSAELRFGPHAVLSNLPAEARDLLRAFLVGLSEKAPELYDLVEAVHAGGFAPAAAEDYRNAEALVDLAVRSGPGAGVSSSSR
jgi:phosphonate transport system substrate-binding protein